MKDIIGTDVLILHYINKNSRASELNQNFWKENTITIMKNHYKDF